MARCARPARLAVRLLRQNPWKLYGKPALGLALSRLAGLLGGGRRPEPNRSRRIATREAGLGRTRAGLKWTWSPFFAPPPIFSAKRFSVPMRDNGTHRGLERSQRLGPSQGNCNRRSAGSPFASTVREVGPADYLAGLERVLQEQETCFVPSTPSRTMNRPRTGLPDGLRGRVDWYGSDGFGGTVPGANRANREP